MTVHQELEYIDSLKRAHRLSKASKVFGGAINLRNTYVDRDAKPLAVYSSFECLGLKIPFKVTDLKVFTAQHVENAIRKTPHTCAAGIARSASLPGTSNLSLKTDSNTDGVGDTGSSCRSTTRHEEQATCLNVSHCSSSTSIVLRREVALLMVSERARR